MDDLERLHMILREEVTLGCQSFFVWKSINNLAYNDAGLHRLLNRNALSWNIILHALQNTFFITMGRLFDVDSNAFSIHALLRACLSNIDQFSIDNLRTRKLRDSTGKVPEWLDGYLAEAYVPCEKDFHVLKRETSKYQKEYESVYRPIRHKVIAHKELISIDSVDQLFAKTDLKQIQRLLIFTHQIEKIVFEFLQNGRLTKIGDHYFDEEEYVEKDVISMLGSFR